MFSKKSVSPLDEGTIGFVFFEEYYYMGNSFFGRDHMLEVFAPSFLCIWIQIP